MKILFHLILTMHLIVTPLSSEAISNQNLQQIKTELKRFGSCIGTEKVQVVKDVIGEDIHMICGVALGNISLSSQNLQAIKHCMDNTRFLVEESKFVSSEYQVFYRCKSIYPIYLSIVSGQSGFAIKEMSFIYQ